MIILVVDVGTDTEKDGRAVDVAVACIHIYTRIHVCWSVPSTRIYIHKIHRYIDTWMSGRGVGSIRYRQHSSSIASRRGGSIASSIAYRQRIA